MAYEALLCFFGVVASREGGPVLPETPTRCQCALRVQEAAAGAAGWVRGAGGLSVSLGEMGLKS